MAQLTGPFFVLSCLVRDTHAHPHVHKHTSTLHTTHTAGAALSGPHTAVWGGVLQGLQHALGNIFISESNEPFAGDF
jgi:hypothetical protein